MNVRKGIFEGLGTREVNTSDFCTKGGVEFNDIQIFLVRHSRKVIFEEDESRQDQRLTVAAFMHQQIKSKAD